jgi:hypothetical protein
MSSEFKRGDQLFAQKSLYRIYGSFKKVLTEQVSGTSEVRTQGIQIPDMYPKKMKTSINQNLAVQFSGQ